MSCLLSQFLHLGGLFLAVSSVSVIDLPSKACMFFLSTHKILQGNLILADSKYEVLTLLRSHRDDAKGFAIMARHPYPIHTIKLRQPLSQEQLTSALNSADDKQTLKGTCSIWVMLMSLQCWLDVEFIPHHLGLPVMSFLCLIRLEH